MDIGILLVRVVIGLALAAHGAQKLIGWFGGYGIKGTGGFMETLGFRPGALFATVAGIGEFGGGLLTALGLLGPVGPALILSTMLVATLSVHIKNGFFASSNGYELPLAWASGAVLLAFVGFGPYSLDAVIGFNVLSSASYIWIVLAVGVLGGFGALAARRSAPAETTTAH